MSSHSPGPPIDVVVVGSLNVDAVMSVESIPVPGETVLGGDVQTFMGGKGLNQAIAAARAGAGVAMIGRVGDDDGGRRLRSRLDEDGVDHRLVGVEPTRPSGMAFITVDRRSDNAIVVSPGANATLTPDHIHEATELLASAAVVLVQLEVPLDAVEAAVAAAKGTVILNPAPAPAQALPASLLGRTEILVPNRGELAALIGEPEPESIDDAVDLARRLISDAGGIADERPSPTDHTGPSTVIVTLGAEGAAVVRDGFERRFPAPSVAAVDTTGAGDCFCGSLAARLALGDELSDAVGYAVSAAALSVTRPGASDSLPTADEVAATR